ncbi:TetR/AcrR family transcriptional regulator [Novosphingobium sp.]|uniref:TetR/AcrR family transcriptional regulator n=1 Tax=Novosphingobium sp. TaxID=1874826 RepID=UPI003D131388
MTGARIINEQPGEQARKGAGRPNAEAAERKHTALIEAALEEFASRGFRGASLRAIAAKADISTRTLYNHYADKVALFAACLEASSAQLHRVTLRSNTPAASAPDTDLAEALIAHVVAVLEQLSQERSRQITALLYREGAEFADVRAIARVQFERYQVDPVVDILHQHGMSGPALRDEATQFVAMAFGEWQRRLLFGGPPMIRAEMEQQAKFVVRLFLCGAGRGTQHTV